MSNLCMTLVFLEETAVKLSKDSRSDYFQSKLIRLRRLGSYKSSQDSAVLTRRTKLQTSKNLLCSPAKGAKAKV